MADDLDAIVRHHGLAGNRQLAIAAALHSQIDDDRARAHGMDHVGGDEPGGGTPWDQRRGDDDVLLGDMGGGESRLLGLILLGHFLGVAARRLGLGEFLVLDGQKLRAKRLDLFLGGGTHVGRRHDGAEAPCGGDGLQARDAHAHDEDLGRRHGARRRHHHRQRPAIFPGAIDDGPIARQIGLRRQHVHDLRASDARHEFHGEGGKARLSQLGQRLVLPVGVHDGDDGGAGRRARQISGGGPAHGEHHLRASDRLGEAVGDLRASGFEIRVGDAGGGARPGLHHDLCAEDGELLDRFRRHRDAGLDGKVFSRNSYAHANAPMKPDNSGSNRQSPARKGRRSPPEGAAGRPLYASEKGDGHEDDDGDDADGAPLRQGNEQLISTLVLGVVHVRMAGSGGLMISHDPLGKVR